jgi:glycosyltransferase involved in cell wall biosynthesis
VFNMSNIENYNIIFLNQMAGPLFRELAEDLAQKWKPCLLYTGHPDTIGKQSENGLHVTPGPVYDRANLITRLFSWLKYFIFAVSILNRQKSNAPCLIVSNPPFLGLAGLLFKLFRGQRFVMLVYDIYPDILVETGRIRNRLIAKCWDMFNRLIYIHADQVITISDDMACRLNSKLSGSKTKKLDIPTIHPWADVKNLQPIAKTDNWFAQKHQLENRTVVLYSGNMGHTHDIESILAVAEKLSGNVGIHFLFIGEGAKWHLVEQRMKDQHLNNITLLPFQPESVLPYSMASGDLGIVAYQAGSEGCMLPSKACYYMAAGLAPIIISRQETDLGKIVEQNSCGHWIKNGNIDLMATTICDLHNDPEKLKNYRLAARQTAETLFSRNNTAQFTDIMQTIIQMAA